MIPLHALPIVGRLVGHRSPRRPSRGTCPCSVPFHEPKVRDHHCYSLALEWWSRIDRSSDLEYDALVESELSLSRYSMTERVAGFAGARCNNHTKLQCLYPAYLVGRPVVCSRQSDSLRTICHEWLLEEGPVRLAKEYVSVVLTEEEVLQWGRTTINRGTRFSRTNDSSTTSNNDNSAEATLTSGKGVAPITLTR